MWTIWNKCGKIIKRRKCTTHQRKTPDSQWISLKLIIKTTQWKNYKKSYLIKFINKKASEVDKNKDKNYFRQLFEKDHSIKKVESCFKIQMTLKKTNKLISICTKVTFITNPEKIKL